MLSRQGSVLIRNISHHIFINGRSYSSGKTRVTVLGALGNIGQPLSMMLKNSNYVDELALYDVSSTQSLAMELSHIDTKCRVMSYNRARLDEALTGANIVAVVATAPNTENLDFKCMFKPNAHLIYELTTAYARICPKAFLAIATNPLNSIVPVACEVLKRRRLFDHRKVFGVTSLDVMRTNVRTARLLGIKPERVKVPVIGGHSDKTIVPVLSRCDPPSTFDPDEIMEITNYVQASSEDLIKAKKPGTLAMSSAFAIARFVISLSRAMRGEPNIIECAYVRSNLYSNLDYLATPLKLSPVGIESNLGIPPLSEYEECMLQNASLLIKQDIDMATDFCAGKGYQTSKGICSPPALTYEETFTPEDKCKKDYVTCQNVDVSTCP